MSEGAGMQGLGVGGWPERASYLQDRIKTESEKRLPRRLLDSVIPRYVEPVSYLMESTVLPFLLQKRTVLRAFLFKCCTF